jgi:hypothetical protein
VLPGRTWIGFFQQWFHTTGKLDYALGAVSTTQQPDGSWRTRIEVTRTGENFMPVVLKVGEATRRLDAQDRAQVVTVDTRQRPGEVILDPDQVLIDVNPNNNRQTL